MAGYTKSKKTANQKALDEAAKKATEQGLTYGQYQAKQYKETIRITRKMVSPQKEEIVSD